MSEADARTFVVRVSQHDQQQPSGRRTRFYAVMADTREQAAALVREAVEPSAYVEVTDGKLLPATAEALGLRPGEPKAM
jgi:hypothetical protein